MPNTPKGLSDEKAARMMTALRQGRTLRTFGVKAPQLEAYFKLHPDYEREAGPLIAANAQAAQGRKAVAARLVQSSEATRQPERSAAEFQRARSVDGRCDWGLPRRGEPARHQQQ
jgi:hypothetical protein